MMTLARPILFRLNKVLSLDMMTLVNCQTHHLQAQLNIEFMIFLIMKNLRLHNYFD